MEPVKRVACIETALGIKPLIQGIVFRCLAAKESGLVILDLGEGYPAAQRGQLLRWAEARLKEALDLGIVVYLEVAQDKNALRKFRGVLNDREG